MPRYRLTIAYDGTDFCGWQKQEPPDPSAPADEDGQRPRRSLRTVQGVVEEAVREVVRERVELLGASRTDAGVHARAQCAAFTSSEDAWPTERGTDRLARAINSRLPEDVLVTRADRADDAFDPVGGARSKGYSYTLHVARDRPLWDRRFVHHVWVPLDEGAMRSAAGAFVGEHDFAAFAAAGHGRLSTVRRVLSCSVRREPTPGPAGPEDAWPASRLRIEVAGTGFLWNMVRIIAGTLVDVGRGRIGPDEIASIIASRDRRRAGPTMPATGLCLEWIRYDDAPGPGAPGTPDGAGGPGLP